MDNRHRKEDFEKTVADNGHCAEDFEKIVGDNRYCKEDFEKTVGDSWHCKEGFEKINSLFLNDYCHSHHPSFPLSSSSLIIVLSALSLSFHYYCLLQNENECTLYRI